ncbi:MAG: hydroxyisourate hydrolase [Gemmatimonadaceae bacterium]
MSAITTHVLDIARGRPAAGIVVRLEREGSTLAEGITDSDGRVAALLPAGHQLDAGAYRLIFHTDEFFRAAGMDTFYPEVVVTFVVRDPREHHHVPLLLAPFGYTTYRGS